MNTALNNKITIQSLSSAYAKHSYAMFQKDDRDFNFNLFGLRSSILDTDTFNDIVGMFWKYQGTWQLRTYAATTDPGLYYFANPATSKGTHIMAEGQYKGAYALGRHQGKYEALVQVGGIDFYVDNDRDTQFDRGRIDKGILIGANVHSVINKSIPDMATAPDSDFPDRESTKVGNWSAACQVLANPHQYREFIALMYKSKDLYGNKFTYTLFEGNDF